MKHFIINLVQDLLLIEIWQTTFGKCIQLRIVHSHYIFFLRRILGFMKVKQHYAI